MLSSPFWTEPHFTGVVLILGALLFLGGASLYTPIKDEIGITGDAPPFLHYLIPMLIGILLLL
jgi:hypothetical protein